MGEGPRIIDDSEFRSVVSSRASTLLGVAARLGAADPASIESALDVLTRPLLAVALSEASQLEEILDSYGANRNERWRALRGVVAALKLFARVHYSLVHLDRGSPHYRLLPIEGDLAAALLRARLFTARVLHTASRRLVAAAASLGFTPRTVDICEEILPVGRLAQDCPLRHVDDVAGTVTRLATAFLNLTEEASALAPEAIAGVVASERPALPREQELRRLAEDFHNLQALYDTHVASTDAETCDPELLSLRGHATVVYHLLETATDLTHHYERHVLHAAPTNGEGRLFANEPDCIGPEELESVLRDCTLFAARYVRAGRSLAQQVLRRYAEQGEVTVPVPPYRGFHVRPSTLVARVAYHYGSPLSMTLEDESYDASSPFELFRANELINAKKRRWLAQEIGRLVDGADDQLAEDLVRAVRSVVMRLAEEAKVILYEQPIPPIEGRLGEAQPVVSFVVDAVARLQALGKIDIVATVTAKFRGDRRVLADIQLLAASGYGEDAFGNNVALPPALSYLRH
jgi:hypothetical protein